MEGWRGEATREYQDMLRAHVTTYQLAPEGLVQRGRRLGTLAVHGAHLPRTLQALHGHQETSSLWVGTRHTAHGTAGGRGHRVSGRQSVWCTYLSHACLVVDGEREGVWRLQRKALPEGCDGRHYLGLVFCSRSTHTHTHSHIATHSHTQPKPHTREPSFTGAPHPLPCPKRTVEVMAVAGFPHEAQRLERGPDITCGHSLAIGCQVDCHQRLETAFHVTHQHATATATQPQPPTKRTALICSTSNSSPMCCMRAVPTPEAATQSAHTT